MSLALIGLGKPVPGDILSSTVKLLPHLPDVVVAEAARDRLIRKAGEERLIIGGIDVEIAHGHAVARATVMGWGTV